MGDRTTRAIRGATTVDSDSPDEIRHATRELLETIVARNDLTSEFPAHAARELGWLEVPLLCTLEIPVPGSLPKCIRVLLHVQTTASRAEIRHVYLHAARALRPDLAS